MMVRGDRHGWIMHAGGPCPVARDARVDIRLATGGEIRGTALAASFWSTGSADWWQPGGAFRIIAYRLQGRR